VNNILCLTGVSLPPPEQHLVYDFGFAAEDIQLDRSLAAKLARLINKSDPAKEAFYFGKAMAKILAKELAVELRMRRIKAYLARDDVIAAAKTAFITGRLLLVSEGDSTLRTFVGFGLGRTEMRTQVQLFSGTGDASVLLTEATTTAKSNMKPGLPSMIGAGGAAGGLVEGAAVAGVTTISNEEFFAVSEADAKRTATALADWVADYYRQQGWLLP
jgi:hypothetical protein